jgi:general secretion pathway protein N
VRSFRETLNWLPGRRRRFARTGLAESTLAEQMWQRTRNAAARWGWAGVVIGLLFGLIAFAPAGWLANRIANATDGRLLLTEARGTVWSGSAVLVLTGGPDSRDATALPGRLSWRLGLRGLGLELRLSQACCINGELAIRVQPGFGRLRIAFEPPPAAVAAGGIAQWPASTLNGLGSPFNTMQLGGLIKLASPGFTLEGAQGRWHMAGQLDLLLLGVSSRLSTLDTLGSYRLSLQGDKAITAPTTISLTTIQGNLQINGSGEWTAGRVHFNGEAHAAPGSEGSLNNLLNIIGRRRGALSLITIG